jgi:hypothetical protein
VSPARQGLRLTFGDGAGVAAELAALVALERECCGFADWSLRTGPGQILLDVSGGTPAAVAAIKEMFTGFGQPG